MSFSRLARYLGLMAVTATIVIGFAGASPRDARAAIVVGAIDSAPGPTVQYLDAANTWQNTVNVPVHPSWDTIPGTVWVDTPLTGAAPSPNPVTMRAAFTLPTGCVGPSIAIQVHADNWADFYLNGPVPVAAANFIGGQPHAPIAANFQNPPEAFAAPPPNTFVNPGANWLYIKLENFGGPPDPNNGNPRGVDFHADVSCDQVITTPPPTLVYECFLLQQGQDPNRTVMLDTDNFGKDVVTVRTSDLMCETANKFRLQPGTNVPPIANLPPPTVKDIMQCFRLQKGQDPDDPAILTTSNFGPDQVRIRTSIKFCESALKIRAIAGGTTTTTGSIDPPHAWQCFRITDGQSPNALVALATNNFGVHRAFVREAVMMCEFSAKYVPTATGNLQQVIDRPANARVYECFRLVETPDQAVAATLVTKNFQNDAVRIRRANLMCEPAKKQIILTNPNPNEPIPGIAGVDNDD